VLEKSRNSVLREVQINVKEREVSIEMHRKKASLLQASQKRKSEKKRKSTVRRGMGQKLIYGEAGCQLGGGSRMRGRGKLGNSVL